MCDGEAKDGSQSHPTPIVGAVVVILNYHRSCNTHGRNSDRCVYSEEKSLAAKFGCIESTDTRYFDIEIEINFGNRRAAAEAKWHLVELLVEPRQAPKVPIVVASDAPMCASCFKFYITAYKRELCLSDEEGGYLSVRAACSVVTKTTRDERGGNNRPGLTYARVFFYSRTRAMVSKTITRSMRKLDVSSFFEFIFNRKFSIPDAYFYHYLLPPCALHLPVSSRPRGGPMKSQ